MAKEDDSGIEKLPEGCVSNAIALTSPLDACRSSVVSTAFRAAADSDLVWNRFLPADTPALLSLALHPIDYSSKRDLFFRLSDSILIDGGKMSMWLERSSGAKCYALSARALSIVWGDTPQYWRCITSQDSRFAGVAELVNVCWLEIDGHIQSKMLIPKTTYAAYLIFKLADWSRGLNHPTQEASVTLGLRSSAIAVHLQPRNDDAQTQFNRIRSGLLWERDDGWMKAAMGEFYNEEGKDGEVVMSFMDIKGGHWKKGLIVQGIEIRPRHTKHHWFCFALFQRDRDQNIADNLFICKLLWIPFS